MLSLNFSDFGNVFNIMHCLLCGTVSVTLWRRKTSLAITGATAAVVLHFLFQLALKESQNLGVQGEEELQPKLRALSEYIFWGLSLQN